MENTPSSSKTTKVTRGLYDLFTLSSDFTEMALDKEAI